MENFSRGFFRIVIVTMMIFIFASKYGVVIAWK